MLRISIPSNSKSGLTFSTFENEELPKPPNGIDTEGNNNLVLIFDDEEEAIEYADELTDISSDIEDTESPLKLAINDIIGSIENDEFVKSYNQ